MAICFGFFVELVTPPCAEAKTQIHARISGARTVRRIVFDIIQSPDKKQS
jgi:hypothetical protein